MEVRQSKSDCFIILESHWVECTDCKKVLCNKAEIEDHVCHTKDDIYAVYKCDNCDVNFKTYV